MHIDLHQFREIEQRVRSAGYDGDIDWSENVAGPICSDDFALEAIFVICNSGMRFTVAQGIFDRVMAVLSRGLSATSAFGHPGKSAAIDEIWRNRSELFDRWMIEPATLQDQLEFCRSLPWIGEITKFHLAKNLGVDVAKPDVHLQRLADANGCTAQELCERLAAETGLRVATVDVILWRACATGIVDSRHLAEAE